MHLMLLNRIKMQILCILNHKTPNKLRLVGYLQWVTGNRVERMGEWN